MCFARAQLMQLIIQVPQMATTTDDAMCRRQRALLVHFAFLHNNFTSKMCRRRRHWCCFSSATKELEKHRPKWVGWTIKKLHVVAQLNWIKLRVGVEHSLSSTLLRCKDYYILLLSSGYSNCFCCFQEHFSIPFLSHTCYTFNYSNQYQMGTQEINSLTLLFGHRIVTYQYSFLAAPIILFLLTPILSNEQF